jgi:hypothetical protein
MRERRLRRGERDRWRFGSRSDPWRSEDLLEVGGAVDMWGGGSRALLVIGERQEGQRGEELSQTCHVARTVTPLLLSHVGASCAMCVDKLLFFSFINHTVASVSALTLRCGQQASEENSLTTGLVISLPHISTTIGLLGNQATRSTEE